MNSLKKITFFHFLLCFSLLAGKAFASFVIPEAPKTYVNDYAGLLNESSKQELEKTLKTFEEETSNQILVAVFPGLEGENLEDVSIRLAEKWKVGQKAKDNGVILLIFKNDRKLRIEVGYGLEAVLTDALSNSIIQNDIVPYFKQGFYSAGISAGVSSIVKATQGEYKGNVSKKKSDLDFGEILFILFIFGFILLPPFMRHRRGENGITFGPGPWGGGGGFGGGSSGGGFSGGGGGFGGGGSSGNW